MAVEQVVERLGGLLLVMIGAGALTGLMFWLSRRRVTLYAGIVVGYPAELFPLPIVVGSPPLQALVAAQRRLIAVDRRLPVGDRAGVALAVRLALIELRGLMDAAYLTAAVIGGHGASDQLDELVAEVQAIEEQLIDRVGDRLLGAGTTAGGADATPSLRLSRRLVALRRCADEIADTDQIALSRR